MGPSQLLKSGVLLLGALAIGIAGQPALKAEEAKLGGGVDVGFGILDQESTGGFKKLEAAGTARINASATMGAFEAEAEIGFIDDAGVEYTEHAVRWNPSESVTVTLSGSAFGVPGVDGFLGVVAGEGTGVLGNLDVYFDYSDAGLFNVNFGAGAVTLGVAVSDTCIPECGTDNAGNGADEERNTFIFTVQGSPGSFSYQIYGVSSTGTYTPGLEEGKGSGFGLSLGYAREGFEILSDVSAGKTTCVTGLGCSDDVESTNYGVALKAGGLGIQHVKLVTEVGASEVEATSTDVVYHFTSEGVTYGPQYSEEVHHDGVQSVTDYYLHFAISMEF